MERVSDKNMLIGISCGNSFVMNPLIAFKVRQIIQLYCDNSMNDILILI